MLATSHHSISIGTMLANHVKVLDITTSFMFIRRFRATYFQTQLGKVAFDRVDVMNGGASELLINYYIR